MKPEALEALLIDRALGALSPETAELLDNYLIRNPAFSPEAEDLAATVQLARKAAAFPIATACHVPALNSLQRAVTLQRRRAFAWELSRLAACLIIGVAAGFGIRSRVGTAARDPFMPAIAAAVSSHSNDSGGRNGFWTLANFAQARLREAKGDAPTDSRSQLHWDSPIKMPHMEGNL